MTATARIGISGWRYPPWRGVFYPKGLQQRLELEYASRRMNSIEINGSFYSLQTPASFQRWYAETPDDFVMSVKGPRFITHLLQLNRFEAPLANFLASGVLALGPKLGPILWQLPPRMRFDPLKVEAFLSALPRSTVDAVALAKTHDKRLDGRDWLSTDADRPLRHALEVRHPSFETPELVELLRRQNVSLVVADTAGRFPAMRDLTADFVYARLHGADELYVSGYTDAALDDWATIVRGWLDSGRDAYVYFDNDMKVRSPFDAMGLAARLRVGPEAHAGSGAVE